MGNDIEKGEIQEAINIQNIAAFENTASFYDTNQSKYEIDEHLKNITFSLYFQKILQYYKKKYRKVPEHKINYKKLQKLFSSIDNKIGRQDIEVGFFPNIDFTNDTKYIEEIQELSKKYLNKHSRKVAVLFAIQDFLNKYIKYPFFMSFYHNKQTKNKLPDNTGITQYEINYLLHNLQTDEKIDKTDKGFQKLIRLLKQGNRDTIKQFLINHFKQINSINQKVILSYFGNYRKDEYGNYLYSFLSNTKIEDLIDKYKIGYCTHMSLIAKHFFNKIYNGKDVKMIYLANPILAHAYNVLLFKTGERIEFIYIDFLGNRQKILEDNGKHKYDIIVE